MYFYFSVFGALFYLIFYSAILAFMAAGGAIIYQTLNWNVPRLQGADSLLQQNPCKKKLLKKNK